MRCCCYCCCSLRFWCILTLAGALVPTVLNPILDQLIVGPAPAPAPNTDYSGASPVGDVVSYPNLMFHPADKRAKELYIGPEYILMQSAPRWLVHLLTSGTYDESDISKKNVTFFNARGKDLQFEQTGFILHKMPHPSATTDWRSTSDVKHFQAEMEPLLLELVPGAKRVEWTYNVVRNGNQFGDQPPAVNSPHLDYSQNDSAREEFHGEHGVFEDLKEQPILLGRRDTDEDKLAVLLGIWKPIYMETAVCDRPLAIMDARTFRPAHERPFSLHINFLFFLFHNLNGAIVHHPSQRWWYYPMQEQDEVLVFTQYTRGKHFANPHTSFDNPHCPPGMDKRQSVEMRAAVFV